jgi:hypothetical protein
MSDSYPRDLEIEIDRDRLRNYLRGKALLSWLLLLGSFGAVIGMAASGRVLEEGMRPWGDVVRILATGLGSGLAAALVLAGGLYVSFSHGVMGRFADALQLTVEGPFLRIRQRLVAASDRKLHFRAIVDYAVVQDPLMRLFGIQALQMTTTGGGTSATIIVPGVKDCLRAREMLSEIDCWRENQA